MNSKSKIYLFALFMLLPFIGMTQLNQSDIPEKFNRIKLNQDSTVSIASVERKGQLHGYSIEFDRFGHPNRIGKYKNGKRSGKWYDQDGTLTIYRKSDKKVIAPPYCGTITMSPSFNRKFYRLSKRLLKLSAS